MLAFLRVRLGVSAKIFAGYAVLLVVFAATSVFTLVYLHRARQQVLVNQHFFAVQSSVDEAWRALGERVSDFSTPSPSRAPRVDPRAPRSYANAVHQLDGAVGRLALALAESNFRRTELEAYRAQIADLGRRLGDLQGRLGMVMSGIDDGGRDRFQADLVNLLKGLQKLKLRLQKEGGEIAEDLAATEQWAVKAALALGAAGLLAAIGAALFMLRTLRPLRVLRLHARRIAGGEYARGTGVDSRDEIGDLAREFDAMAEAILEREHRLIRSERLATVGRMAAHITHEVRNPLASIGLYVELLGDELPPGDAAGRRLLASLAAEVDRLSEITETYLRFVRLPKPKLEREDLGAIVAAVMEFARAELAKAGVSLEMNLAPGLPEVAADENQVRQALLNLVRNAREAMAAGGSLRVALAADRSPEGPGLLRLSIADTGPGIAPDNLAKIFDPFFSTKAKGTGLGLALVHQIVAEHGGRIEVDCPPSGGTTFVITLPIVAQLSEPASAAVAVAPVAEPAGVEGPVVPQAS